MSFIFFYVLIYSSNIGNSIYLIFSLIRYKYVAL